MEVLAKMRSPVVVIEKDKLYWVWLHVDRKVAQVGNGVEDSLWTKMMMPVTLWM